ncbi:proline racemase family protein [Myxosarcina sp. GI1(2024)]
MTKFTHIISAIDAHTAGEPTRIILSGLPPILGSTMAEKKQYTSENLDYLRTLLMQEPRGHRDMFGAIITPPTSALAQLGVLFMDNAGYIDMYGSGIIAIATALIKIGTISPKEPETVIVFDTPAGVVETHAKIRESEVVEVSMANVSSFLYARDVELMLPEVGQITIDISFGGNFFAIIPARALGIELHCKNISQLIQLGKMVKQAVNEQIKVEHPKENHITKIELTEIYDQPDPSQPFSKSVVVFGNGQMDRCPCGTGTSALMATLYSRNKLQLGVEFTSESIIGTQLRGKLIRETQVGDFVAVLPVITGNAYLTGIQQFVVEPNDPLKYGFVVEQ